MYQISIFDKVGKANDWLEKKQQELALQNKTMEVISMNMTGEGNRWGEYCVTIMFREVDKTTKNSDAAEELDPNHKKLLLLNSLYLSYINKHGMMDDLSEYLEKKVDEIETSLNKEMAETKSSTRGQVN